MSMALVTSAESCLRQLSVQLWQVEPAVDTASVAEVVATVCGAASTSMVSVFQDAVAASVHYTVALRLVAFRSAGPMVHTVLLKADPYAALLVTEEVVSAAHTLVLPEVAANLAGATSARIWLPRFALLCSSGTFRVSRVPLSLSCAAIPAPVAEGGDSPFGAPT